MGESEKVGKKRKTQENCAEHSKYLGLVKLLIFGVFFGGWEGGTK
jgi:hypothetical protein